jgi:hypothetical protein
MSRLALTVSISALALTALAGVASAQTVYNPTGVLSNPGGPALNDAFATDTWLRRNVRAGSSAGITTTYARNGNGSAQMTGADGVSKADFEYFYSDSFTAGRTLGNLNALSFDFYRNSSSTVDGHLHPALRLYVDADGNSATTADRGYLIFERAYNPSTAAVPTDQWVSNDVFNWNGAGDSANLWLRQFGPPGATNEVYDRNLQEWIAGDTSAGFLQFSASSVIFGLSFGIGSGWNGTFDGAVDNLNIGFSNGLTNSFNFEVIPLPPAAMAGLGTLGMLAGASAFRRRRAQA